jgi:hypothetical protein
VRGGAIGLVYGRGMCRFPLFIVECHEATVLQLTGGFCREKPPSSLISELFLYSKDDSWYLNRACNRERVYNPYLLRQIQIELPSASKVLETESEGSELSQITLSNIGSFTL